MKPSDRELDPRGREVVATLRVVGLCMAVLGGVLTTIGVANFCMAFYSAAVGTFAMPRYFWCALIGLPLFGFGMQISGLGFLGAFTRYVAGQTAPVQRDTFNYMAEGTSPGIRTIAEAVGQGFASGTGVPSAADVTMCHHCRALNSQGAHFCDQCGTALGAKTCPRCAHRNEPGARFCPQCGCELA